jgi:hypothetical protein
MALITIAESTGIGLSCGAIAGLILIPLAWWIGQPGLPIAAATLALGGSCGLLRGLFALPSQLQAAKEADRQLCLHDLLSTVFTLADSTDPWQSAILADAEQRCRTLRPSMVIAHRLSLRAWSGIGILSALLLTSAILISQPVQSRADLAANQQPKSDASSLHQSPDQSSDRQASGNSQTEQSHREFEENPVDANDSAIPSHGKGTNNSAIGGGLAVSPEQQTIAPDSSISLTNPNQSGPAAPGTSGPESPSNTPGPAANGSASSPPAQSIAPWQSDRWPADISAANQALKSGNIPDEDADLVRDYFARE